MLIRLVIVLTLLLLLSPTAAGADQFSEKTYQEIERSLISQDGCNRLLPDCPSLESNQMREDIRSLLAQGLNRKQVMNAFVARYGQAVLAEPPATGFNLLVWVTPFVALAAGLGVAGLVIRRWIRQSGIRPKKVGTTCGDTEDPRLDEELKKYL